jgi:hypothetical protein
MIVLKRQCLASIRVEIGPEGLVEMGKAYWILYRIDTRSHPDTGPDGGLSTRQLSTISRPCKSRTLRLSESMNGAR